MTITDSVFVQVLNELRTQQDADVKQFVRHVDLLLELVGKEQEARSALDIRLQMVWELLRDPSSIEIVEGCPDEHLLRELQMRIQASMPATPPRTFVLDRLGKVLAIFPDTLRLASDQTTIYLGQVPVEIVAQHKTASGNLHIVVNQ